MAVRNSFEAFYAENYPSVMRFAERRIADRESAREIAAEAFVIVWRKFDPTEPPTLTWLYAVARNLLGNAYGKRAREVRLMELLQDRALLHGPDPEIEALDRALFDLAEKDRESLRLTYWELLTAAEVGAVLGCSEQAAWKRISRAKAAVRQKLESSVDVSGGASARE